jgi:hypothetical protein
MDSKQNTLMNRRNAFRAMGTAIAGGAFACLAMSEAQAQGQGPCTSCACPGFIGAGSYPMVCQRCSHSWSVHR